MPRPKDKILAVTLLLTGLVVLAYVPLVLLAGMKFTFATFVLYVLFPCLAIYFIGTALAMKAERKAGVRKSQEKV